MGSIVRVERVAKATGKPVTAYRAYVRRDGFASKSKVCKTEREAKEWLRNNDADAALQRKVSGLTLAKLIEAFVDAPPIRGTRYWSVQHLEFWREQLGPMRVADISRGDINGCKAKLQARAAMQSTSNGPKLTSDK